MLSKQTPNNWSSVDEHITYECIIKSYFILHDKWLKVIDLNYKLNQNMVSLKSEKDELEKKVCALL